jgi:hypothetical protein
MQKSSIIAAQLASDPSFSISATRAIAAEAVARAMKLSTTFSCIDQQTRAAAHFDSKTDSRHKSRCSPYQMGITTRSC